MKVKEIVLLVSESQSLSVFFFFSSRRRHTRSDRDWSSDVCSSDLDRPEARRRSRHRSLRRPLAVRGPARRDDDRAVGAARRRRGPPRTALAAARRDRKSTRLNSSHDQISYAVFCLKKKKQNTT